MQANEILNLEPCSPSGPARGIHAAAPAETAPGLSLPSATMNSEVFLSKIQTFGVDTKLEEKKLQDTSGALVSFVRESKQPVSDIHFRNTVLAISTTEWQALASECTIGEVSWRADLTRALRLAVALRAAIQEEIALFRVRQKSNHLWKNHLNSLLYLGYCASKTLPELERLTSEASKRGLLKKAEHISEAASWLRQRAEEVCMINPESETEQTRAVRVDPNWEENRLQEMLNHLISLAKESSDPLPTIQLPNTVLSLSATQWQALVSDCPAGETSFRSDLNQVLRRAVGLLARMQEEIALYNVRQNSKYEWKKHLDSLFNLADSGTKIVAELEQLTQEATRRNLLIKAEHITETVVRLTECLTNIPRLHRRHNAETTACVT